MENHQVKSVLTEAGHLELFLESSEVPVCREDEVVIEVHAAPINPADILMMFGAADMSTVQDVGTKDKPRIRASVLGPIQPARIGKASPWGIEGSGIVVATGEADEAKSLMGKTVAVIGGAMYSRYRVISAKDCLRLEEGTTAREGASCFVNPQTVIGMVETMRMEGHSALVHTAAASSLGRMLQKFCRNEGVELVNIVRKESHVDLLKNDGAKYVCNSSSSNFLVDLSEAIAETQATICFDAVGGGGLAGSILAAMNSNTFGASHHKQLYFYGNLDKSPTTFNHSFGTLWSMGRYQLGTFLQKLQPDAVVAMRNKIVSEIKTTFATSYSREISLKEALSSEAIAIYHPCPTGEKYLINPSL
mgnify:FL=1